MRQVWYFRKAPLMSSFFLGYLIRWQSHRLTLYYLRICDCSAASSGVLVSFVLIMLFINVLSSHLPSHDDGNVSGELKYNSCFAR
ncbi:hypothetical protein P8452_40307 [Trifolium repens]|nr:hypothetical protein P8452_40307 [Trifolium repens]